MLSSRSRGESRALLTVWRRATAPFGGNALSLGAKICATIAVLSLAAIAVRAMPWVLDPRVGWSSIGVFARGLVLVAAETSVVLGWPIAATLVAAAANDRGECASCLLIGVSPRELAMRMVPAGILIVSPVVMIALLVGDVRPGAAMMSMVEAARRACDPPQRSVAVVPMTEAAWLCREGNPAVLTLASRALVRTTAVQIDDDARTVHARDVEIDTPGPTAVHVHVRDVTFRGLPPSRGLAQHRRCGERCSCAQPPCLARGRARVWCSQGSSRDDGWRYCSAQRRLPRRSCFSERSKNTQRSQVGTRCFRSLRCCLRSLHSWLFAWARKRHVSRLASRIAS